MAEIPALPAGDAGKWRGGVWDHPSFPGGGHNKAGDWVVGKPAPTPKGIPLWPIASHQ